MMRAVNEESTEESRKQQITRRRRLAMDAALQAFPVHRKKQYPDIFTSCNLRCCRSHGKSVIIFEGSGG